MDTQKLKLAFSKSKDMTLNFLGHVLSSTRVEPIRSEEGVKGIKASWVGQQGESSLSVRTEELNAHVKIDAEEPPAVEYVQYGEKRGIAVKNINNISCTVDQDTLDQFVTPKGAAVAVCAGAAVGLLGWFVVTVMRAVAISTTEQDDSTVAAISAEDSEATQENLSNED